MLIIFRGKNSHPFSLSLSLSDSLSSPSLFHSLAHSLFLFLSFFFHLSKYFLPTLCLSFYLTYLPTRPISMLAAVSRPQIIADTMLCRHVYDRHVSCPRIAFVSALISSCFLSFSLFPPKILTSRLLQKLLELHSTLYSSTR